MALQWSHRVHMSRTPVALTCRYRVSPSTARRLVIKCMAKPWRPSIDDVDSISRGGPAKVRGTGSRNIPHRLNAEERTLYDMAKKKGFLAVRGTGYRKFRHGYPLPNIYRQWCDARAQVCVVVEQDPAGSSGVDRLVVDLAPLRLQDTRQVEAVLYELAADLGVRWVGYDERPEDVLPFNILPPEDVSSGLGSDDDDGDLESDDESGRARRRRLFAAAATATGVGHGDVSDRARATGAPAQVAQGGPAAGPSGRREEHEGGGSVPEPGEACLEAERSSSGGASSSGGGAVSTEAGEEVAALEAAVAAQAAVVRRLKETEGRSNQDAAVRQEVKVLLQLKADLQQAQAALDRGAVQESPLERSCTPSPEENGGTHAGCSSANGSDGSSGDSSLLAHAAPLFTRRAVSSPASANGAAGAAGAPTATAAAAATRAPAEASEEGGAADAAPSSSASAPRRSPLSHYYKLPIWQIHAVPVFFEAERPAAKQFAAEAVRRVAESLAAVARR